ALAEWPWLKRPVPSSWIRNLVAGGLVLAMLAFVIPRYTVRLFADYTAQTFGHHRQAYKIERGPRVFYTGKQPVAQAMPPLIDALDKYSRTGDSLIVGTDDMRKTPYSDAFIYYLFPELKVGT